MKSRKYQWGRKNILKIQFYIIHVGPTDEEIKYIKKGNFIGILIYVYFI